MQSVAILTNRHLLLSGITAMLREKAELNVVEIESTAKDLEDRVSELKPAFIVFDCDDETLANRKTLWSLIQDNPGMTVVSVGPEQSDIQAYTQRRVVHAQAEDLLGLIATGDLPAHGSGPGG